MNRRISHEKGFIFVSRANTCLRIGGRSFGRWFRLHLQGRSENMNEKSITAGTGDMAGLDNSVGIATCYGLDDPGFEYQCGQEFLHPTRPTLAPTQLPMQWAPCLSRG